MYYYLILITSKINANENLVSIVKSRQQLNQNFLRPIVSLMEKHINCFLNIEGRTQEQIGKLSLYKLIDRGETSFRNEYATGEMTKEEDIETGKLFDQPLLEGYDYDLIQEGYLIKKWENYESFKKEKRCLNTNNI